MVELFDIAALTLTGILLTITVSVGIKYYRLLRSASAEYEKAKSLVEDIVRSFNRELRRETEKLDTIGYRIEGQAAKIDAANVRVDKLEKIATPVESRFVQVAEDAQKAQVTLNETGTQIRTLAQEHESLKVRLADLQAQVDKFSAIPEFKVEPVIPLKRDKAMASLTETEIAVLEMLAAEGAKTAPEIKERVKLSREHTARLMKKLYEEGYLERETGKIPFKYNVKKEMQSLLKKPENPQS